MDKALKLIKAYGPYIVIYILLVFIGYQCTRKVPEQDPVIIREDQAINRNQIVIDSLLAKEQRLIQKGKRDSAKYATQSVAYKREIKVLKHKVAEKRIEVQPILDSIPEIFEFVALLDSTSLAMQGRIDELEIEKFNIKYDFKVRLQISGEMLKEATEMNAHFKEIADYYKKKNRKLRRQNTWIKVGIVAVAVVAIFK